MSFLSLLETWNQVNLVPFFFAQNGYCSRNIALTVELEAQVFNITGKALNRSHRSKSARSFLCSDHRLAKQQRPCELLFILLLSNISRGARRLREEDEFLFFSSYPEQSLIITSSSSVTVCTVGIDMVTSAVKGMDVSGWRDNTTFRECNTLQPTSQFF